MPRKRKTAQPTKEVNSNTTTMTVEPPSEAQAAPLPVAPPLETPVEPLPVEQPTTFVERLGKRSSPPATADPLLIASDNVAGVRLFENRQARVMAIKFDERPAQTVIDVIKEAGFRWNPADSVWTQPVRGDSAMATRIDAERLYQQIRQMIRQDKGTRRRAGYSVLTHRQRAPIWPSLVHTTFTVSDFTPNQFHDCGWRQPHRPCDGDLPPGTNPRYSHSIKTIHPNRQFL